MHMHMHMCMHMCSVEVRAARRSRRHATSERPRLCTPLAMDLAFCTLLLTQPFVWLLVAAAAVIQSPVTLLSSLLSRRKPRSFSGRHVLITGGSEGIGLEIAKQCAARGATVTLVARTRSKLDAARASVLAATPNAKVGVQTADVSQAAQVAQAVELGEKELGPVDVCIAAAGASIPKYFEDLTHEDFAKMMSVNYFGGMPQRLRTLD